MQPKNVLILKDILNTIWVAKYSGYQDCDSFSLIVVKFILEIQQLKEQKNGHLCLQLFTL